MKEKKFCPFCASSLVTRTVDGVERRACPDVSCAYVDWDNPVPVVAALIEHEGSILLARNRAWPEKTYGLITGFLEKGESPEEGVVREVREETGLEARIVAFIGNVPFFQANQLLIAYHLTASGEIQMGGELAEIRRVDPAKLKPWPFGTGIVVARWLEGRGA